MSNNNKKGTKHAPVLLVTTYDRGFVAGKVPIASRIKHHHKRRKSRCRLSHSRARASSSIYLHGLSRMWRTGNCAVVAGYKTCAHTETGCFGHDSIVSVGWTESGWEEGMPFQVRLLITSGIFYLGGWSAGRFLRRVCVPTAAIM